MEQIPTDSSQTGGQPQQPVQVPAPQFVSNEQITPAVSPEPPTKSSRKKLLLIAVMIGFLTGGGVLAYILVTNGWLQKEKEQTSLPKLIQPTLQPTEIPTQSSIISDDFDSATLDTKLWNFWTLSDTSRAVQNNGKIEIEIPAGFTEYSSAGVDSTVVINGDFEATVDAEIVQGGDAFGSEIALVFHEGIGEWTNQLSIFLVKDELGGVSIRAYKNLNGEYTTLDFVKSYEHAGPFTISLKREKGIVTFSYKEGAEFVTLGQLTSGYYVGSGIITLHVNTFEPNFPGVISTFDNFVLKLL